MAHLTVRNQKHGAWAGIGFCILGAWFLYDSHERRGKSRPFALRFVPGG